MPNRDDPLGLKAELEALKKEEEEAKKDDPLGLKAELQQMLAEEGAQQESLNAAGWIDKNIQEPFIQGITQLAQTPTDMINMALAGVTGPGPGGAYRGTKPAQIPGNVENLTRAAGLSPEGETPEGVIPRAANLAGAAAVPFAGSLRAGAAAAKTLPVFRSSFQNILAPLARNPGVATVGEGVSSLTAAMGGDIARRYTDNESVILMSEMASGFTPVLAASTPSIKIARKAFKAIPSAVAPFTKAGAFPRAARRLQNLVADPKAAAARINTADDGLPQLSPARQTGEPKLIGLESKVLELNPGLEKKLTQELNAAKDQLRVRALEFGGDVNRPRELLRNGRDYLIELLNVSAAEASQTAIRRINSMRGELSSRQISNIVREELTKSYTAARASEKKLWGLVDGGIEARLDNATATLRAETAGRGPFADPNDIPKWLKQALRPRTDKDKPLSFNDVRELRTRVDAHRRQLKAQPGHSRNAVRILNDVDAALLDDLAASGAEGAETARAFSRHLNDTFSRGPAKKMFELDRTGAPKVADEMTLQGAVFSQDPGNSIEAILKAAPDSAPAVEQGILRYYTEAAWSGDKWSKTASDTFIAKMERGGAFDVMPGLRNKLGTAHAAGLKGDRSLARLQDVRGAGRKKGIAYDANRSRAALYLDAEPGEEFGAVLHSKNPRLVARSLHRRMRGDEAAEQGLKQLFMEEIFKMSRGSIDDATGEFLISGRKAYANLKDYRRVMDELRFTPAEKLRAGRVVKALRQADIKGSGQYQGIVEDTPGLLLDFLARLIGSKSGARFAQDMGSGLVMAQFGSQRMRGMLASLTRDKAAELVTEAMTDPDLFKALLVRSDAPLEVQSDAAQVVSAWLIGAVAESDVMEPKYPEQ